MDPIRPLPPAMYYITLHSMVDISKQVSEGQKKWSQGADLISINDINDYVKFKILEYRYYNFINNDMWEQYKEDFADFMEATFKTCKLIVIYNLQTLLCYQSVWVKKDKQVTIVQSLYNTIYKKD